MAFAALLIMDKFDRKLLLVISGMLMVISRASLGVYYLIKTKYSELSIPINWLPLICIIVYISAFSIGYGPLPWVLLGEIYSPEVCRSLFSWANSSITVMLFFLQEKNDSLFKLVLYNRYLVLVLVIICSLHMITA